MTRKSTYDDDYENDDTEYTGKHQYIRRYKKNDVTPEKQKSWDRESNFDTDNDYDEHR